VDGNDKGKASGVGDDLAHDLSALDFAAVSPEEFARIVKGLSARQLGDVMRGDLRTRVLGEVFGRMKQQFRPEAAGALTTLVRWKITGESEEVYEAATADGACVVTRGRAPHDPRDGRRGIPQARLRQPRDDVHAAQALGGR